jgi:hypothetical protein
LHASTSLERNKQILDKFTKSIKSEVTGVNVIEYINAYMRHCHLYEEEEDLLLPLATSAPMLEKAHEHIYLYLSRNIKDLRFFFHYDLSAEKWTYAS